MNTSGLVAASVAIALSLAGCAALPGQGPLSAAVEAAAADDPRFSYAIVDVTAEVASVLALFSRTGFEERFGHAGGAVEEQIGVGDVLNITIFEAGPDGLFSTIERKQTPIQVSVDSAGRIAVPYVGSIPVSGRTTADVRTTIIGALRERALEPDVIVQIFQNNSRVVYVNGAVRTAGQIPILTAGNRVLDVIAIAGGPAFPAHESFVSLSRGNVEARVPMQLLVNRPSENVFVRPGDRIFVIHDPQTFTALGSVTQTGQIAFAAETMSLIEAVGLTGGLRDDRADAEGIFLFRYEDAGLLSQIRPDVTAAANVVPVVYRLNLRDPRSYIVAQTFPVRDKDVIYVANAYGVEFLKFMTVIGGVRQGIGFAKDVKNF